MKPCASVLVVVFLAASCWAQEPPSPTPSTPSSSSVPGNQTSSSSSSSSSKKGKDKPVPSFLILGTIFNEKALSFPGVQVRIRQAGEKKYHWETYTNFRGEFAVRVPPGYEYEVITHVKNYQDQSRNVDSKVDVQQRLSIQLEPLGQPKTGAKP
jgi:hypothetical protein